MTQIKTPYQIFAITMALLLFFTTSGLTMDMHFCGDQLKRINFFGKAKTCAEMAQMQKSCCAAKGRALITDNKSCGADGKHEGCCNNEAIILQLDTDLAQQAYEISLSYQFAAPNPDIFTLILPLSQIKQKIDFLNYKPPLIERDLQVFFQSFLC